MKRILTPIFVLVFAASAFTQNQPAEKAARLNFEIVKAFNDKPIHNAYIVLHQVNKKGNQGKSGIELKTDIDGKSFFEGYPFGKVRIQVIADGFQTYGQDIDITQPVQVFHIKMERPKSQYSIYTDNKDNTQAKPTDTKPSMTPDTKPPATQSTDPKQTVPKSPGV